MLDTLLQLGGYVVAGAMLLFGAWQTFTRKTLPEKWQEWGLWPYTKASPPVPELGVAIALAAGTPIRATTSRPRWLSVAMLGVGLALLVALAARQLSDQRVALIESDLLDAQAEVQTQAVTAQTASDAKDAEIAALRARLDSLTASLVASMGEQRAQDVIAAAPAVPLGPTSLFTRTGITPDLYGSVIESFRAERNLRAITEEELGRRIRDMPTGTFYFVISGFNERGDRVVQNILNRDTYPRSSGNITDVIELHTLANREVHLIGFVDEATLRLVNLDGVTDRTIDLYPSPSATRTVLVSIPVERIQSSVGRRTAQLAVEVTLR